MAYTTCISSYLAFTHDILNNCGFQLKRNHHSQRLNAGWGPRRMCSTRDTCTIAIALPHRFSRPSRVRFCTLKANFRAATDREDDHCVKQRNRMHIVWLRELPSIRTFARSPSPPHTGVRSRSFTWKDQDQQEDLDLLHDLDHFGDLFEMILIFDL